jgi:hypothetical protein
VPGPGLHSAGDRAGSGRRIMGGSVPRTTGLYTAHRLILMAIFVVWVGPAATTMVNESSPSRDDGPAFLHAFFRRGLPPCGTGDDGLNRVVLKAFENHEIKGASSWHAGI